MLNSKESDIARRELSKESQLGSKLSFLMFDRTLGSAKCTFTVTGQQVAWRQGNHKNPETNVFVCVFLDIFGYSNEMFQK